MPASLRMGDRSSELDALADLLRDGGVILYPTNTLWGIGGDARIDGVVEKIQDIKGRRSNSPFILLVNSVRAVKELTSELPRTAIKLMGELWPGDLTLLLPAAEEVPRPLVGPEGFVGVRLAAHPVPYGLLERRDAWLVSTSANPVGVPAPESLDAIDANIIRAVDGMVDHPPAPAGVQSTVVSVDAQGHAKLVREGAIERQVIDLILGGELCG